ncbi:PspC domain-containing protein [Paenibacillus humicola]|uniref:PspC domain-containing protein n=1 Tax=Paenibacillus humicola TaxID=3110540 RepID=UPI00237A8DE1|nr:PspC domain-containing protein [Paenibacillus humicola]
MHKKLYLSRSDRMITGLCGGVAEWLGTGAGLVRVLTAAAALFSCGTVLVIYLLASLVVPKSPYGLQ